MADMRDWQAANDVFSVVAGSGSAFRGRITDGDAAERIQVRHYTEDYLSMFGVTPILGRGFTRDDTNPGSMLVALLGYGYWQSRYGGRTDVIGETIRLDDDSATIVGVLPAWFYPATQLSTPLRVGPEMFSRRGSGAVHVEARLRPDVSVDQARERLSARMATAADPRPNAHAPRVVVRSLLELSSARYRATIMIFAGAVGMIVLIAAVNVAGLLLARGASRYSEFAVRASLGAGRLRMIRQLLTESLALAIPAAALGVLLAWLSLDVIAANLPFRLPDNSPVVINPAVLLMTVALLVPTTLLFSVVPALRLSRVQIGAVLARGSRQVGSSFSRRGGQFLMAAEIAVAVILVTGSGLMIRSFLRISSAELGFNPDGLLTMEVLPLERTAAAHQAYYDQLLQRLRTFPAIASVGLVDNFALAGGTTFSSVVVDGKDISTTVFEATPGYFETIGAAVREGTLPSIGNSQSVVINESAARAMFPGTSAVGRELVRAGHPERNWPIAAVIRDLRHGGPLDTRGLGASQVFFPLEASEFDLNAAMMVVVRPVGSSAGLGDHLREAATSLGPRVLVERIRSANEYFGERVATPRRRTVLLGVLGGLGLILALVGVFGMTAYAVSRRTAEIGVRMAFGARPEQVVRTMLRDSVIPIAIGTVIGLAGAAVSSRVIQSFLFETVPTDRLTLSTVAIVLALSGCTAALIPAMRAARVDPASSLRTE